MRPTLVQSRALLAVMNNKYKAQQEEAKAYKAWSSSLTWEGNETDRSRAAWRRVEAAQSKLRTATATLKRIQQKAGVNNLNANYNFFIKSALLSKLIPKRQQARYERGLREEMARAAANFAEFSSPSKFRQVSPVRSPKRKTPSPQRARGLSPRSPATLAREADLGIMGGARRPRAPANNTRVTWSRNAHGKIIIHKTLEALGLKLTNAQLNALNRMSQNQAINAIRQLARAR